jgi:hypothetical protein
VAENPSESLQFLKDVQFFAIVVVEVAQRKAIPVIEVPVRVKVREEEEEEVQVERARVEEVRV